MEGHGVKCHIVWSNNHFISMSQNANMSDLSRFFLARLYSKTQTILENENHPVITVDFYSKTPKILESENHPVITVDF